MFKKKFVVVNYVVDRFYDPCGKTELIWEYKRFDRINKELVSFLNNINDPFGETEVVVYTETLKIRGNVERKEVIRKKLTYDELNVIKERYK